MARAWLLDRLEAEEQLRTAPAPARAAEPAMAYLTGRADPLTWVRAQLGDIKQLCVDFGVAWIGVTGSVARGDFDPTRSDVDVVVEFIERSPEAHADGYLGLIGELERRLGTRVDLIQPSLVDNPYIAASIASALVVLDEHP